ncbi:hypothetical protein ANN_01601 [Periplaneta americana]|uniref:Uncharacterized protein n=1 Tax=Periplaneta americana TaxID=6978 RepID=A0ABQ8TU28_PERAM|nr:hypothetical protein ANN_01601 [Periplaneta americana]
MMLKLIGKRKRNLVESMAEKKMPTEDTLKGMVNGKRVRGRRKYQMIDDFKIYGSYAETKRKAENRTMGEIWVYECMNSIHVCSLRVAVVVGGDGDGDGGGGGGG